MNAIPSGLETATSADAWIIFPSPLHAASHPLAAAVAARVS